MDPATDWVLPNPYDQVPYPGLSYTPTHPDRLATIAILMGMNPAPVEHCRVLELGCAVGGNLVPMAYGLPGSEFLGVDYSLRQVAEGQAAVAVLGLKNVTFKHLNILNMNRDVGQFDYIIAHGVYSWVPEVVRDKILVICKENLAPNGVAYVSYNTYPGWNMIKIVRDMMLYHTRKIVDPLARASQARAVLDFFAKATASENNAYSSFLQMYADVIAKRLDNVLGRDHVLVLHDEMEEVNDPVYFYEFAERAQQHGLQYLGEADFSSMRGRTTAGSDVPRQVTEGLCQMAGDLIELEQYVDFLNNRTFRRTLLCHQEIELPPQLTPDPVMALFVASRAKPVAANPDIYSVSIEKFQTADGPAISTDHPTSKVALTCLAEKWPQALPFDVLLAQARARLEAHAPADSGQGAAQAVNDIDVDAQVLAANLLTAYGYSNSLVELRSYVPPFVPEVSERPVASAVARFRAQSNNQVTNLRHERVEVDGFERYLLRHLDGSRDRAALLDLLMAGPVAEGLLTVQQDGKPAEGNGEIKALLAEELEERLGWLARAALLADPSTSGEKVDGCG